MRRVQGFGQQSRVHHYSYRRRARERKIDSCFIMEDDKESVIEQEETGLNGPPILSKFEDLELLRLRVLATRKRKTIDGKEEGEVSDHETVNINLSQPAEDPATLLKTTMLAPKRLIQNTSRHSKSNRGRKTILKNSNSSMRNEEAINIAKLTDRFLLSMSYDDTGTFRYLSDSFEPQTCTIILDSEGEGEEEKKEKGKTDIDMNVNMMEKSNNTSLPQGELSTPLSMFHYSSNTKILSSGSGMGKIQEGEAMLSGIAKELSLRELEKQKELVENSKSQVNLITEECNSLQRQLIEGEEVVKAAVEKQQRLKLQLKEVKMLISKSKQLKAFNLTRQLALQREREQKARLISLLTSSIASKTATKQPKGLTMTRLEQDKSEQKLSIEEVEPLRIISGTLPVALDEDSRANPDDKSEATPNDETVMSNWRSGTTNTETVSASKRSLEISNLEKKALQIQQGLMASQLKLLQSAKKRKKGDVIMPSKRSKTSKALGKIMAMNPLFSTSNLSLPSSEEVVDGSKKEGDFKMTNMATIQSPGGHLSKYLVCMNNQAFDVDFLSLTLTEIIKLIKTLSDSFMGTPIEDAEDFGEIESSSRITLERTKPAEFETLMTRKNNGVTENNSTLAATQNDDTVVSKSTFGAFKSDYLLETEERALIKSDNDKDDDTFNVFKPYISPLRIFKSYRFSPHFSHSATQQGLLSCSFTNKIDPRKNFCSNELFKGSCHRYQCPAQHFEEILLDDASVLEDFMTTLLSMPITAPFTSQLDIITKVKSRLLKVFQDNLPLISLVGILLETFSTMNNGIHAVSFIRRVSSSGLESLLHSKKLVKNRNIAHNNLNIHKVKTRQRVFIKGCAELFDGIVPKLGRYFKPASPDDPDSGHERRRDASDKHSGGIEILHELLLKLGKKKPLLLQDIREEMAKLDSVTFDSEILKSIWQDIFNENKDKSKSLIDAPLAWIHAISNSSSLDISNRIGLIRKCFEAATDHSLIVDIAFAATKVLIDANKSELALGLLDLCLSGGHYNDEEREKGKSSLFGSPSSKPHDEDILLLDLSGISKCLEKFQLDGVDLTFLSLLYFHVKNTKTYPHRAFLSFPFDYVRRTDSYFVIPWRREELGEWLKPFFIGLLDALRVEKSSSIIMDWVFANMIAYLQASGDVIDQLPKEASPCSQALWIDFKLDRQLPLNEEEMLLVQSHPIILFPFIKSILSTGNNENDATSAETKLELLRNLVRTFWTFFFGQVLADDILSVSIASHIGLSVNLGILSSQVAAATTPPSSATINDPFLWILSLLSLVILSQRSPLLNQDFFSCFLDSALISINESTSSILVLSLLVKILEKDDSTAILLKDRIKTIIESNECMPESNVERCWLERPWRAHLHNPMDDFMSLNIPSVDDYMLWAATLIPEFASLPLAELTTKLDYNQENNDKFV